MTMYWMKVTCGEVHHNLRKSWLFSHYGFLATDQQPTNTSQVVCMQEKKPFINFMVLELLYWQGILCLHSHHGT